MTSSLHSRCCTLLNTPDSVRKSLHGFDCLVPVRLAYSSHNYLDHALLFASFAFEVTAARQNSDRWVVLSVSLSEKVELCACPSHPLNLALNLYGDDV